MTGSPRILARGDGVNGEIALRQRGSDGVDVYELIVNGVFLMDTVETSTEQLLAEAVLERHPSPANVLVGGLGLGFTTQALIADSRVTRVDVVEIEPLLVEWLRSGLVPPAKEVLDDPRVTIVIDDVYNAVTSAAAGSYDAILLDVDNGPEFLVHPSNAGVYGRAFLASCRAALASGGKLAVWLATPSQASLDALAACFGNVEHLVRDVTRDGREIDYHVYLAARTPPPGSPEMMTL